jgi:hypothetical protein
VILSKDELRYNKVAIKKLSLPTLYRSLGQNSTMVPKATSDLKIA